MIISQSNKFIFFKPMKCAGTSVEYSLSIKYPFVGNDICTGQLGYHNNYGDWSYNLKKYPFLEDGRGEHWNPSTLSSYWPALGLGDKLNQYNIITITRDPLEQLVSYYWWAHASKNQLAFSMETCPKTGDYPKDVILKFHKWLDVPYSASIFKEPKPPVERPHQTLSRINDEMVGVAGLVLNQASLADDCKKYFDISFPIPRFKSGKKHMKNPASEYFRDIPQAKKLILDSFPHTMNFLST